MELRFIYCTMYLFYDRSSDSKIYLVNCIRRMQQICKMFTSNNEHNKYIGSISKYTQMSKEI